MPNELVIQSCSRPWETELHASAPDPDAAAAELVSGTTLAALLAAPNAEPTPPKSATHESHPLEVLTSPSRVLTSAPNEGSTLDNELMIGSKITSSPSACAAGATPHGPNPNANTAPALVPNATTDDADGPAQWRLTIPLTTPADVTWPRSLGF